jgi:uncharacterized protein (DUF2235 family)
MKRIAIFCDGTWNRLDAKFDTNVETLMRAVLPKDSHGVVQQPRYLPGVGSGQGETPLDKTIDKYGGGAFGWGLTAKIEAAYRDLVRRYEVGDEIHVFGFSRGAYTARSLVGLIRNCGVPRETSSHRIPEAMALYKSRQSGDAPWTDTAHAFRAGFSPDVATSEAELAWRKAKGMAAVPLLRIRYVGVWDTVGALGVPGVWRAASRVLNRKFEFHDTDLSSSVQAARHAVAIDERRRTYAPTLWTNLPELIAEQPGSDLAYLQHWFPGVHGAVGGGGDIKGLSNATALWVAEGAMAQGLAFDEAALDGLRNGIDPLAPLDNHSASKGLVWRLLAGFAEDRKGPAKAETVSAPARVRWRKARPPYRPETLDRVAVALNAETG